MAYKVEFPPDITAIRTSLCIDTGNTGNIGEHPIDEGRIIAVQIYSHVLDACIWLALDDAFKSDDEEPLAVFYADEILLLRNKTPQELKEMHRWKLSCGPNWRVRQ